MTASWIWDYLWGAMPVGIAGLVVGVSLGASFRDSISAAALADAYHRGIDALAAKLYDERRVSAVEVSKAADAVRCPWSP